MRFLQKASTRLQTGLIGGLGIGSLLLVFIAGQISEFALLNGRDNEDRAIAAIEAVTQARFDMSLLGVAGTRYLETLDPKLLAEVDTLRASIAERLSVMTKNSPDVASNPDHVALIANIEQYKAIYADAIAAELNLGDGTRPGLRLAFNRAGDRLVTMAEQETDRDILKASLMVMSESQRTLGRVSSDENGALEDLIQKARRAIESSGRYGNAEKAKRLSILNDFDKAAAVYETALRTQHETRNIMRDISRSASGNLLSLTSYITNIRQDAELQAKRTRALVNKLNIGFSALVAIAFVFLSRAVGIRLRAQAATITTNEARFRQLVETLADFAVETDENLIIRQTFMRPQYGAKVNPDDLIGTRIFKPAKDYPYSIEFDDTKVEQLLESRAVFRDLEYKLIGPNYVGWRRCYGAPYYDDKGRFAGLRILSQDITAQKDTERLRLESDASYRAIATAAFGAFYRIDNYGRILSLEGLRSQPASIMNLQRPGRFIWDALADLGVRYPADVDVKERVLNGQSFGDIEVQVFRDNGESRGWFIHRGVPIENSEGHSTGYVIAVANISRQKELEIDSRLKAQELERIIATMPGAFFRLSGRGPESATFEYISPRIIDILGFTPSELNNRPGLNLTVSSREQSYFDNSFSPGTKITLPEKRLTVRRKDGSHATIIEKSVDITQRPDGSRVIEGLLIDISDLAQRDAEIADHQRQLQAIVANMPGWIYGFSFKDGQITRSYCSGAMQKILGYSSAELIELVMKQPQILVGADSVPMFHDAWQKVPSDIQERTFEHRHQLKSKDGQEFWVTDRGRYTRDPDGTIHLDGIVVDVTAEAAAQKESEIIKSAVDSASDVICVVAPDGKALYANDAFRQFAELTPETSLEDVDLKLVGRFLSPDNQTYRATVKAALKETKRYRGELDWESPSGRRRRLDMTIARTAEAYDVVIIRDVTAIRAAAEHRNRLNMAAARVGIARGGFLTDFRSGIQEVTRIAANALEVAQVGVWLFNNETREEYTAIDVYDRRRDTHSEGAVHKRIDYPLYFAALDLMRNIVAHDAANDPITCEFKDSYLIPNGITGLLDTPIFRAGKVLGVLCVERDGPPRPWLDEEIAFATVIADSIAFGVEAEERKVAEHQVVTINSQLNRVVKALDSSQDNIIIEDEDGRIAYMNARAARNAALLQSDVNATNLRGLSFAELFPHFGQKRQEAESKILADLNEYGTWEDELDIEHPDGQRAQLEVRIAKLPDGGQICVATDVTGRKRQAEREAALRMQLAEAQKMEAIGRLAGGIAHDFNNIIAAVAAYASVISGESCSHDQHGVYANKIRTICGRASDIVKQILLFAKAKTATHEPVVVSDIVDEAHELLSTSLASSIEVRISDKSSGAVVMGSSSQLLQVLLNLGLNSGDAINENNGYIEIDLDVMTPDESDADGVEKIIMRHDDGTAASRCLKGSLIPGKRYLRLTVRDNGPGIPNDVLERIFEPFFSTKEKSKGSGLGLPVVYSIVTAHDGAIEIRTTVGHGTRFMIYLPVTDLAARLQGVRPRKIAAPCKGRILIVDDEADLADAMSILLSKAGFEAAPVYSPIEAVDLFIEDPYAWDLVLTDQVMPKMKGVAMAKKLLKLRPDLPIIMQTGYSDSASDETIKAAGIRTLLFKPVEGPVLIQHILAALKSSPALAPYPSG